MEPLGYRVKGKRNKNAEISKRSLKLIKRNLPNYRADREREIGLSLAEKAATANQRQPRSTNRFGIFCAGRGIWSRKMKIIVDAMSGDNALLK